MKRGIWPVGTRWWRLTPEEREARKKGLALVARVQKLIQTDEGFREWIQEGISEIEAGHFVTFDASGWHDKEQTENA